MLTNIMSKSIYGDICLHDELLNKLGIVGVEIVQVTTPEGVLYTSDVPSDKLPEKWKEAIQPLVDGNVKQNVELNTRDLQRILRHVSTDLTLMEQLENFIGSINNAKYQSSLLTSVHHTFNELMQLFMSWYLGEVKLNTLVGPNSTHGQLEEAKVKLEKEFIDHIVTNDLKFTLPGDVELTWHKSPVSIKKELEEEGGSLEKLLGKVQVDIDYVTSLNGQPNRFWNEDMMKLKAKANMYISEVYKTL